MTEQDKNPCQAGSSTERFVKTPKPRDAIPKVHAGSHVPYKMVALLVGLPLILANTISLLFFAKEKERPPFIEYSYLRIRHKKFPWGDGDHSFFHNPKMNATSKGYEEEVEEK